MKPRLSWDVLNSAAKSLNLCGLVKAATKRATQKKRKAPDGWEPPNENGNPQRNKQMSEA